MRLYFRNLRKAFNRFWNVALGGSLEQPISSRTGYWSLQGYKWRGVLLERFINWLFRDDEHCAKSWDREDDKGREAADPEGRYFVPLVVLAFSVISFFLFCIGFSVYGILF